MDFVGDIDNRKNTTSFVFSMEDCAITWSFKKQSIVTLSTCKFEYVVKSSSTYNVIWHRRLLKEQHLPQEEAMTICIDNKLHKVL